MVVRHLDQEERELLKQEAQFFKRLQNKKMNTSDNTTNGNTKITPTVETNN